MNERSTIATRLLLTEKKFESNLCNYELLCVSVHLYCNTIAVGLKSGSWSPPEIFHLWSCFSNKESACDSVHRDAL